MEERTEKAKRINDTLLELMAGILAAGILFQITLVWLVKNKASYSLGLWIGVGLALFLAWHMWKTLDGALGLGAAGAQKVMRKQSLLRYGMVILVLGILMWGKFASPLAAFLGIMTLKVAAYLQPVTHKVVLKIRR